MDITGSNGQKYSDFEFLGKGGMGKVYKGKDTFGNQVVLKLIEVESDKKEDLQNRELVASEKIMHKNVVSIIDTGVTDIDGIKYLYLLEKYYAKGSLSNAIKKEIPLDACYRMMNDLLNGMKEIHKSVIHRDLKPDNILISDDDSLVISDFGLSRFIDNNTQTETFKGWGTNCYRSPECWLYEKNTPAMDIYSLGLIFFEILTGESPYKPTDETREAWRDCHLYSCVPDLSKYRNDTNVKLNQIIQKMTAKKVSERYKSIDEVFEAFLESRKQNEESVSAIEALANSANNVFARQNEAELQRKKEQEETNNHIRLLNQQIESLFNRVESFVEQINERLETGKYSMSRNKQQYSNTRQTLTVSLSDKSFTISFANYDSISNYEKNNEKEFYDFQKQKYGFIMRNYDGSYFSKNNIVLYGLAETSLKIKDYEFGFNLFLKQNSDSTYGDWIVCQFSENITPAKTPFGISISTFFEEFKKIEHHPYFTKKEHILKDNDIIQLIQMISY